MDNTKNPITWYEITKDIIIPILSIVATLIIGIIIALIFKRREEKGKSKQLLVETYMDYINRRINKYSYDCVVIIYDLYIDLFNNYSDYFKDHANSHLATELVKKRREKYHKKIEEYNYTDINWIFYPIKFSLLIGREKYNKEAKELERKINQEINSEQSQMNFLLQLKNEIKENEMICENMDTSNTNKIEYGLDMIEAHITKRYNRYQSSLFQPYDDKVADLISEY
ncbi:hypothetical protein [Cellulophaga sp. E6(2014)]|uniref:hypothetical protein n=1 Tax=Cellulophaga sp. E6(2014) TaxID=1495334 RepID=UPI00051D31A6|nr:hypothetical protein [Cellulophaga sp. E6(2014)]KGK29465.1 hypothetical protein EL45_15285 [Cellulophaga sp. E6(2014)]